MAIVRWEKVLPMNLNYHFESNEFSSLLLCALYSRKYTWGSNNASQCWPNSHCTSSSIRFNTNIGYRCDNKVCTFDCAFIRKSKKNWNGREKNKEKHPFSRQIVRSACYTIHCSILLLFAFFILKYCAVCASLFSVRLFVCNASNVLIFSSKQFWIYLVGPLCGGLTVYLSPLSGLPNIHI